MTITKEELLSETLEAISPALMSSARFMILLTALTDLLIEKEVISEEQLMAAVTAAQNEIAEATEQEGLPSIEELQKEVNSLNV